MAPSRLLQVLTIKSRRCFFTDILFKNSFFAPQFKFANVRGTEYLKNPKLNKDLGFSLEERKSLGIQGLLPPAVRTQDEQVELTKKTLNHYEDDFSKCIYLYNLQEQNEKLFYRTISENVSEIFPKICPKIVCEIASKHGLIFNQPRGLFMTIHDKNHLWEILSNWEETDVKAVIVTNGENIKNHGDLGAFAMGLPISIGVLYTTLGGIKPHHILPITLDVGTNNETLLNDPSYVGLRHRRTIGPAYQEFIDEFINSLRERFGPGIIIQFEGFNRINSEDFFKKYQSKACIFSEDYHCKNAMTLAGLISSQAILKKPLKDYKIVFLGSNNFSFGTADFITKYLEKSGENPNETKSKIWIFDEVGLLNNNRSDELNEDKLAYVKNCDLCENPEEVIRNIKPDVLIGTSHTLNDQVLKIMTEVHQKPLIFDLSNFENKEEHFNREASSFTQGNAISVTNSHSNPCLLYPGLVLGTIVSGIRYITDDICHLAAKCLADNTTLEDLRQERIFPSVDKVMDCSVDMATRICHYAYREGIATCYPEPSDKEAFVRSHLFSYFYESDLKRRWHWNEIPEISISQDHNAYYGRMKTYFLQFAQSPVICNINDKKDDENESPEVVVSKGNFDELKIIEKIPPEVLNNIKKSETTD